MRLARGLVVAATVLTTVLAAASCRATKSGDAEDIKYSGFLSSYDGLTATDDSDMAAYRWIKPDLDLSAYHSILFDKPVAQMSAEALKEVGDEDMAQVLGVADQTFREHLKKRYTLTDTAGPGVLRIRTALAELDSSSAVLSFTRIVPVGIVLSKTKQLATGTGINVGKVGAEMEMVDSVSGERLAAAVDRRVGTGVARKMFTYWGDVEAAFETWAERTSDTLQQRGMPMTTPGAK